MASRDRDPPAVGARVPVAPAAASSATAAIPWPAKLLTLVTFAAGLAVIGASIAGVADHRVPVGTTRWVLVAVVVAALTVTWWKPLILYRGDQSAAIHGDEAFFLVAVLLTPVPVTVIGFALAAILAQVIRRRSWVKSAFNVGQLTVAVFVAGTAAHALHRPTAPLTAPGIAAGIGGAAVLVLLNSGFVAAVLAAAGAPWRAAVIEGWGVRARVVGSGVVIGVLAALACSVTWWSVFPFLLVILILRQILIGHFQAHHDRVRLRGLFDATLEINRNMREDGVARSIVATTRRLLRCPVATITEERPGPGELGTPLASDDHRPRWLVVSGRSRAEPFDTADAQLLEAIAAVGAAALRNAALYRAVRRERQLASEERERLSAITSSIGDGVVAVDAAGYVTFLNPAAASMLGWEPPPAGESSPGRLTAAPAFLSEPARRVIESGAALRSDDAQFEKVDGTTFPVTFTAAPVRDHAGSRSRSRAAVIAFQDMTDWISFEKELTRQAFYDSLTGLPNRTLFLEHLDHALRKSMRSHDIHSVLFADIDRFKVVNDNLGHHSGDQLLVAIARRMRSVIRSGDMLARFGGDEFTLLLENTDLDGAAAMARRLHGVLGEPITLDGGAEVVATLSIGVARVESDRTGDDVLRDADVAMYQAKATGRRGHTRVFDAAAMSSRSAERQRLELETGLRKALARDELEVFYQPLFSIDGAAVVGAEALVRWNHPTRGRLEPVQFIGIAEDSSLILQLGQRVLADACRQVKDVAGRLGKALTMNVNLSPREFYQASLVDDIAATLREAGVPPHQICLEITETVVMDDLDQATRVLHGLKDLGVGLAIDDFGTGYSSLGYLKHFPIDEVKIDQRFVGGLGADAVDTAIVTAVIDLAKAVGITAVAEGVETADQLALLERLGCNVAQGYYFTRPMTAAAFIEMLSGGRSV